jgi:hypothetical protein
MNRNWFGAVVGLCLALAAVGLAKTSMWRQAGTMSREMAQFDAKYKDRCPYYPSPVLCFSRTVMGRTSDREHDFDSAPREILVASEIRPGVLGFLGSTISSRRGSRRGSWSG